MSFYIYVLRCADNSYYTGHTDDLERRIAQHRSGEIKGYTSQRLPVELMWSQDFATREEAIAAELQVKNWSRAKKEALFRSDWVSLGELAKPPSRRLSRHDVSTSSTSARNERTVNSNPTVRVEPASSNVETRRRDHLPGSSPTTVRVEPASRDAETRRRDNTKPIIILVRPQLGQNIGKAARAMMNFGLTELRLVSPRDGWPNPEAGPAASGADRILAEATLFDTVADAIGDCSLVYASTVRRRDLIMPVVGPEEMASEIRSTGGKIGILFGPERSGLESEDVALATKIVTVPINPEFGSLNLAQAVILLAYEWSRGARLAQPTAKEAEPPAQRFELEGLVLQLEEELDKAGYFHPPERMTTTKATLRTILTKPQWSSREVQAMRGVIRALATRRSSKS